MALFQKDWAYMIVGLGNPGAEYAHTRHNVGFRVSDLLAQRLGVKIDRLKFQALTRPCVYHGQQILLVQPQTYMNLSGAAVGALASYYKIPPEKILVIFDDISLPVGRIRLRQEGSAGGHNGGKSIIRSLGSEQFPRNKVGVGGKTPPDYDLADWVLGKFQGEDKKAIDTAIKRAADAVECVMEQGLDRAMGKFNG